MNYPLRLVIQPDEVRLTVQDAAGAAVLHAAKRPDPNTPKEDLVIIAADADLSRPLYTMVRAFPKWFHVQDEQGRDLCMVHERPAKTGVWGMDIYDVGDPVLHIGKDSTAAARPGGLGGLFKGLVTRATPALGYRVSTLDDTPILRLLPDSTPDQYVLDRLAPVSPLNEQRALISLLGLVLHPLARPARRR